MADPRAPERLLGHVLAEKFELVGVLGVGAMGTVYRAKHRTLEREIALKVLDKVGLEDPTLAVRFKAEARAASRLDHPNSVQIFDFGEDQKERLFYIAMELLHGDNLGDVLKREKRFSPERAVNITMQILAALAAAHRGGVIHRDLKPANIMLHKREGDDGRVEEAVKVCDFGIAKILDAGETVMPLTQDGAVFGTPAYMSPEQARGEKLDARTDLYSTGTIFYKMLSGTIPFPSDNARMLLMRISKEDPQPISRIVRELDARFDAFLLRALARDKQARFQNALEMRGALKELTQPIDATARRAKHATQPPPTVLVSPALEQDTRPSDPPPVKSSIPPATRATTSQPRTLAPRLTSLTVDVPAHRKQRTQTFAVIAIVALVLAAGGALLLRLRDPMVRLTELVSQGSYGVAESHFLENFEALAPRLEARALAREALRLRRAQEQYQEQLGITWDPSLALAPSKWKGHATLNENKAPFVLALEHVDDGTLEGTLDWPDHALRTKIHGIWDGNHLVFWESEIVLRPRIMPKEYALFQKLCVFVDGERIVATKNPYMDSFEGTLASR